MSARRSSSISLLTLLTVLVIASTATGQGPKQTRPDPSTVVVEVGGGFHWLDAGLGAVAALATALLVVGLALTVRRSGR